MHRFTLLLGFPFNRRPWLGLSCGFSPQSHCLRLTKGLSRAQTCLTSSGTPGCGVFSEIIPESQKSKEKFAWGFFCLFIFFFFQKLVLGERSSLSACQLQLFSSVLSWPLRGFCCQGPGRLGNTGGMSAAQHGYDADIRPGWDRARAATHESVALSAWLPA